MMELPSTEGNKTAHRWGHVWISLIVCCLVALAGKLVYIQTEMRPRLIAYRDERQTRQLTIPAKRGMILDTRGRILAGSDLRASVFADPTLMEDPQHAAASLAPVLGVTTQSLIERIRNSKSRRFVWLARHVSAPEATAIQNLNIPGVNIRHEPHRYYPNGSLLAHVLGFVDIDGRGLEGIERQYDMVLSGTNGHYRTMCTEDRQPLWLTGDQPTPPQDGDHIVLTIDLVIQEILERQLQQTVREFQAESAVGIVISPQNSDILGMACWPTFDPNVHSQYPEQHKRNRCITDPVEPGSCFKPFVAAAAVSSGVVRPDEELDCGSGYHYFGRRRIKDTHSNGVITLEDVLVKSSNIGMGIVGTRLGNTRLHNMVSQFGFGQESGIDLPGENKGILLPTSRWSSYSKTSIPMGQELAVTPLQLANALAALAHHGVLKTPKVVRHIVDAGDGTHSALPQEPHFQQAVSRHAADIIAKRAMVRMVNESHHDVQPRGYSALGKTGTAQVPYSDRRGYEPGAYVSTFMAAAPANAPQVAVIIMVRKPNHKIGYYGGKVAGPAVKQVIQKTLAYWQVKPDSSGQHLTTRLANNHSP